jgi:DNA-binding XRE family transcriptional regulator
MRNADLAAIARIRADLASGTARAVREAAGVSRAEIAAAAGVTRQAVHAWETHKAVPSARNALAYARALTAAAPRPAA